MISALASALTLCGCRGDDASSDASNEASIDAGNDASSDAGRDAALDATFDAASADALSGDSAAIDASSASPDAHVDAMQPDADTTDATDMDSGSLDAMTDAAIDASLDDGGSECVDDVSAVPAGVYDLMLRNETLRCSKSTFQCTPVGDESGAALLTITATELFDSGQPTGTFAIDATLVAPTLDLDSLGTHMESYEGMLVGDPAQGVWDPSSTASTVRLAGDVCVGLVEQSAPGTVDIEIDRITGEVLSFERRCEYELASTYYVTTSSDDETGALRCTPD